MCKPPFHQFFAVGYPGTRDFNCTCARVRIKYNVTETHRNVFGFRVDVSKLEFIKHSASPTQ